jgi:hypothetical protein
MSRPHTPNQSKAYKLLQQRLKAYTAKINAIYDALNKDAARIALNTTYDPDSDTPFSFDDYPTAKRAIELLQQQYISDITATIYASTEAEWRQSNLAQTLLAKRVLSAYGFGEDEERYYFTNSDALKAFQQRTVKGMNLSRRVWNLSEQYKQDLELSLSVGIQKGVSANDLARTVQKYLNEPNKLFRRVRDKYGNLQLSQAAKAYHPGRGVYRSSFRNARRLTASETNMAYRTAEQLRWKQMDFIVGYEIKTSKTNHPIEDICDELAGKYPKDFQWTGWHPLCYSDDSEVLTNNGWKLFKDVEADDLILSLNPQTRNVEWVKHVAQQCYDYDGEMIYFHNRSLDCLVTPEHRMVYLDKSNGEIKYSTADEFTQGKGAFYRGCVYRNSNIREVRIGSLTFDADTFFEFMGYWLADGSVTRKSFVSIAQLGTDANIKDIRSCVERMGFMVHNSKDNVSFNNKTMRDYLSQFGHAADKFVPAIIKQASRRQIRIFLKAFVSCDGHVRTPHPFIGNRGGLCISARDERVYYTSSKQLAADLGELILKAGHRPSYSINSTKGTVTHFRNGDYAANYDSYSIRETYAPTATVFTKERVHYVGKVYDLTLERNHIMYIRRNGKCFWGSNCRCYSVPIIKTDKEYLEDAPSASEVKDVPGNFKQWVEDNQERIAAARERGTEPYFIRNNAQKIDEIIDPSKKKLTALERAAIRHENRTPEQEEAIKLRWQQRKENLASQSKIEKITDTANRVLSVVDSRFSGIDIDTTLLKEAIKSGNADTINAETRALAQLLSKKQQLINKTATNVTKVAAEYNEVDASALQAALASKSLAEIQTQTKLLAQQILKAKQAKVNSLSATAIAVEKIDVNVVPEMQYTSTASKKMTWGDKADNAIRAAIYYDGEKGIAAALYKKYIGNITDTSRAKSIIKQVDSYIGEASVVEYPAIEHLMTLRNTKDLSVINPLWRSRYNELIKELNKYDYSQGIKSIISKIEEAHNILKLSTTKKAVDFGLNKLSHRTPYQIFDEFEAKIPGFSASCPSKEFFDMFTEYVPLFTKGKGAYFSGMKKHVLIALNDSDNIERLTDSVWYRRGLFTHEFGHANDILTGQRNDAKLKKIFDDWKSEIAKDKGAALEKAIVDALQPYRDSFKNWWENSTIKQQADAEVSAAKTYDAKKKAIDKRTKLYRKEYSKQLCDIEEQIGCLSDCLGAALGGARFVTPRGHTGTYFLSKDKQYGEFIAHCSENYWSGNAHFKSLAPQLYEAMRKYIESKLPKK